jgi:RNA polymerase primary sigma factor
VDPPGGAQGAGRADALGAHPAQPELGAHPPGRAESLLAQVLRRTPSDEELARVLDEPLDAVRHARRISTIEVSLDAPVDRGGDREAGTFGERFADEAGEGIEEETDQHLMREHLERALSQCLTPRERKILALYYGLEPGAEDMTLERIGELMGVTRERIRQIRERAFAKLRESPDGGALAGYWGTA